jgi:spermidine/putrescine transport system permease protein
VDLAVPDAAEARRPRLRRVWAGRLTLLGPGVGYWLVFFVAPVGLLLVYSVFRRGPFGGVEHTLTLDNYARLADPIYLRVLLTSLRIALMSTALALLLGFPAAYFIATAPRRWRVALLFLVILPFWTSFLIRTYAWMVLLNPTGLINRLLGAVDIGPLSLLYNELAIVIGLTYAYLPLMVLPIYSSIERLGGAPAEVAGDLYASPWQTFRRVLLPLTLPGVVAGSIFVFVPSMGNFIVPELLGGGQKIMVGNLIQQQFLQTRDWPFGATLAVALIAIMLVLLAGQAAVLRREQGTAERSPAREGGGRRGRGWLRAHVGLVFAFLYLPIVVLVGLSFNETGLPTAWGGFSMRWYRSVISNAPILRSVRTTLIVAVAVTAISTVLGTLLAVGLHRTVRSRTLDSLLFLPAVIPDIVLAIGLLSFFNLARFTLGIGTIVIAHVVFDMIFVAAIVRTRLGYFDLRIEEAARDLYAGPVRTFLKVTLPVIAPGIVAGALVAFTLSVDEFVIAFFNSGPSSITFPIRIYSMIRFGVTPEINAIAAFVLAFSLLLIVAALRLSRSRAEGRVQLGPIV